MEAVLGEVAKIIILMGGVGEGGGSPSPSNPDNVAAGGETDAQCGEGGKVEGEGEG